MWGLGIGDWGLESPIPNPQSPIILNKLNKNLVIKYLREFRINNFKNK